MTALVPTAGEQYVGRRCRVRLIPRRDQQVGSRRCDPAERPHTEIMIMDDRPNQNASSGYTAPTVACTHDGTIAVITLVNESKLNALTVSMWKELKFHLDALAADETTRCIVIKGAGSRAFSAGADIAEFETERSTHEQVVRFHEEYVGACLAAIINCKIPVVSQIRGVCMGGGLEIACATDIRLADTTATFGAPVGRLGFPLAFAETQVVFSIVGPAVSAELLIEGRILTAAEALTRNLVTRVTSPEALQADVNECVKNICKSDRFATSTHKCQLRRLRHDPSPVTRAERLAGYAFADTEDYRNGYRGFLARK